jgi:hypothetical protein
MYINFELNLYYGTLNPLKNNNFEDSMIDPYSISVQNKGVCLTTSPKEAYEVYAKPPVDDDTLETFEEVLEARKSEWYSKTEAILRNKYNLKAGAPVDYNKLKEFREKITLESTPSIYKCSIDISKGFIVSENYHMDVGEYTKDNKTKKLIQDKYYPNKEGFNLSRYEQTLRMMIFNELNLSMDTCADKTNNILSKYAKKAIMKPEMLSTKGFYEYIGNELESIGLKNKISKMFSKTHDALIIEKPSEIYANANYGDNVHVEVFDLNKIKFMDKKRNNPNPKSKIKLSRNI